MLTFPFVGRKKERKLLDQSFDEALNYNGSLVLIRGEAGVGKSRLLEEFVKSKESHRVWVLAGKSLKDDMRSFSPFLQMIESQLERLEYQAQWLIKFIEPETLPSLAHFLPELKENYPIEIPSIESEYRDKGLFFNAIESFFSNLSKFKPLVLIIDDILWMDRESLELFKYIVFRIMDKPMLILCATRPWEKNTPFQKMIDELAERRSLNIFDLENLTEEDTDDLITNQFRTHISSQFIGWLFHITKGNPLFISEVLNVLQRRNILFYHSDEKKWNLRDDYENFPLSPTIESIIKLRLRNLTSVERSVLQTGSVLGEEFESTMLRQLLSGTHKQKFLKALHRLKAQRLLEERGRIWRFSHPLIREMLYKGMAGTKRSKLHRKIGLLLKKTSKAQVEEITHHLITDITPEEETPELCQYLLKTGKGLLQRYNEQLGWRYLTLAKKIAKRFPKQLKIEGLKCEAELSRLRWTLDKDAPSTQEIEKVIERLKISGLREEAAMLYRILFYHAFNALDMDVAERYLKNGLSLSLKSEENYWVLRVEDSILKRIKGRVQEAEEEALRLVEEVDPKIAPRALYRVLYNLGTIAFSRGELKTAHEFMCKALRVTEQYNLIPWRTTSYANLGQIEMKLGQLDSALVKLKEVVKDAELTRWARKMAGSWAVLGICLLAKGEFETAFKYFDDSIRKSKKINYKRALILAQLGKVEALLETDKIDEAVGELNSLPTKGLGEDWLCDVHFLKSRVQFNKGNLKLSKQELDRSLKLAEKLNLEINIAKALAQKGMILLRKNKESDALTLLDKAKQILQEKGALPNLGTILTRFGFVLGGEMGEQIFIEGLNILLKIGAFPRVEHLLKEMEKKKFRRALGLAHQRLRKFISKEDRLKIITFGGLSIKRPGELRPIAQSEWQSRKAKELLGLILVLSEPKGTTREILASYLWPEANSKKSQSNFRVTLARLNHTLDCDCIHQETQFISFDRDLVRVDFLEFERLYKEFHHLKQQGKLHPAEKKAQTAIALYKGDFLPEFYDRPIDDKQMELKEQVKELLYCLSERSKERLEWQEAISSAFRMIALDSSDEKAYRIIIEGLWGQGDRVGAIRQFKRLKTNLKKELGISPSSETLKLYKKIVEVES